MTMTPIRPTGDLTLECWTSVPGWTDAKQTLETAKEAQRGIGRTVVDGGEDVRAAVYTQIRNGDSDVTNLIDTLAAITARNHAVNSLRSLTDEAVRELTQELGQLEREYVDTALETLGAWLAEVVDDVRAVAKDLGDARDAEQVIAKGGKATAAWQRLNDIAERYRRVRGTQDLITQKGTGGRGITLDGSDPSAAQNTKRSLARFGVVRDAGRYYPVRDDYRNGAITWDRPAWADHTAATLLWAIDAGAQLWVPTVTELGAAVAEHENRISIHVLARSLKLDPEQMSDNDLNDLVTEAKQRKYAAASTITRIH